MKNEWGRLLLWVGLRYGCFNTTSVRSQKKTHRIFSARNSILFYRSETYDIKTGLDFTSLAIILDGSQHRFIMLNGRI